MNDDQARLLATRFIDTWPTGPRAYVWRDILTPLDHPTAVHAYRTLTRERGTPTPGQFHEAYNAHRRTALAAPDPTPAPTTANTIALQQYLERLGERRARGDVEAADELDHWANYGRRWTGASS